jgi:hypothetical protein
MQVMKDGIMTAAPCYEQDKVRLIHEKHSWPQAEVTIGFINAYETTYDEKFLNFSHDIWHLVNQPIKDQNKVNDFGE